MGWKDNTIMEWSLDGSTWTKITDHGRSALEVAPERIGYDQRMFDGTKRRVSIAKKRSFSLQWENLPSVASSFLANGATHGKWFEEFYNTVDGAFYMRLRSGQDANAGSLLRTSSPTATDDERLFRVMITDYSKSVAKRGTAFDMWSLSINLEEV